MGKDGTRWTPTLPLQHVRCQQINNVLYAEKTTDAISTTMQRNGNKKPQLFRCVSTRLSKMDKCIYKFLVMFLIGQFSTMANELACPEFCQCSSSSAYTTVTFARPSPLPSINCSNQNLDDFLEVVLAINKPKSIENKTIQDYHLHVLDMSNNLFTKVQLAGNADYGANVSWLSIDSVDLSHNFISGLEVDEMCPFEIVLSLDLSFNHLENLNDLIWSFCPGLEFLREINLSHNAITELENSSFDSLVQLKSLDLSFNQMRTVSSSSFEGLISLQYLYLNGNNLNRITDVFPYLPNMAFLDLSNNILHSLPDNIFSNLNSLTKLNLANNSMTYLEASMFNGLTKLVVLSLDQNLLTNLDAPVFQHLNALQRLSLSAMPHLNNISHDVFSGLSHLNYLNLSENQQLRFLHPNTLSTMRSLQVLDLSHSGFQQLSATTFHTATLRHVFLRDLPLSCICTNAWLMEESAKINSVFVDITSNHCIDANNQSVELIMANFSCGEVHISNTTSNVAVRIGSKLMLQCQQESADASVLTWTTPSGEEFYHHGFHPHALLHLLTPEEVQPDAEFHKDHYWHDSTSYHTEISSHPDRIVILTDGSLYIDYMLRQDAGDYTCEVRNHHYNHSITVTIHLDYEISGRIKIFAFVVGFLCALGAFTLNVVCVIISWTAHRLVNKRRREIIHQMLESLNAYKSTQVTRIHENYLHQLSKVRNQYHIQRDRLHNNYTIQVTRVKRGCSNQMERVRDNYNSKLNQLREYSSRQIMQIREGANNQIGRIRDYGSLQLDRLRETYKLQQQHVLKLLDTMNLDNCRSVVETECMRTESMMFDIDLLGPGDRMDSPMSPESDYNTAASSPNTSDGLTSDMEDNDLNEREIYDGLQQENEFTTDDNESQDNDIQMEMNTRLSFAGGIQLDAKEVWKYTDGNHTLYTNINVPGLERQAITRENHSKPMAHWSQSSIERGTRKKHDHQDEPALLSKHLLTLDLDTSVDQALADQRESPTGIYNEETWSGSYVTPEASPIKFWSQVETPNEIKLDLNDINLNKNDDLEGHDESQV